MGANSFGYQSMTPASGDNIQPANWCEVLSLEPATTLATLTVNMPQFPNDGQRFTLNSTQGVIALTQQIANGLVGTLIGGLTGLVANTSKTWVYDAPRVKWKPA